MRRLSTFTTAVILFETLPPTFSIVADASGARLRCLLDFASRSSVRLRNVNTVAVKISYLEKLISELSGGRAELGLGLGLGLGL